MYLIDLLVGVPLLLVLGCHSLGFSVLLCILLFIYSVYVDTISICSCLYAMMLATDGATCAEILLATRQNIYFR